MEREMDREKPQLITRTITSVAALKNIYVPP